MPYIREDRKKAIKCLELVIANVEVKGELTYCIYKLGLDYIKKHGTNYQTISDAIGAMSDAEHELRRRVLDKYETEAIRRNGDIE
ncbi:MAG: DUF6899 family protein [Candidatus Heimdallarchaeaceae archaeon]